jgi:hypothetical protein
MISALRLLCLGLLAGVLAGCVSDFQSNASLEAATPPVRPLKEGSYLFGDGKSGAVTVALDENGLYEMSGLSDEGVPETLPFAVFGPVNGLYVVQLPKIDDATKKVVSGGPYSGFVARIEGGARLFVGSTDIDGWLGEALFAGLDLPLPEDHDVGMLTDNAGLNWAIVQRVLVQHGAEIEFIDEPILRPAE